MKFLASGFDKAFRIVSGSFCFLVGGGLFLGMGFGGVAGAYGGGGKMQVTQIVVALVLLALASIGLIVLARWAVKKNHEANFILGIAVTIGVACACLEKMPVILAFVEGGVMGLIIGKALVMGWVAFGDYKILRKADEDRQAKKEHNG